MRSRVYEDSVNWQSRKREKEEKEGGEGRDRGGGQRKPGHLPDLPTVASLGTSLPIRTYLPVKSLYYLGRSDSWFSRR